MVKVQDFSRPLSVFQVLFKANLIFKTVLYIQVLSSTFQARANPVCCLFMYYIITKFSFQKPCLLYFLFTSVLYRQPLQFGLRSGLKNVLFDTLMVFLKEFFEKDDFEKNQQMTKHIKNYPACKELSPLAVRYASISCGRLNTYIFWGTMSYAKLLLH